MTQVNSDYHHQTGQVTVFIEGEFDEPLLKEFEQAYTQYTDSKISHFVLDFKRATYLDSSILGELMKFCEYAESFHADIFVVHMNDEILNQFRLLNLHKLFKPEYHRETFRVEWVYKAKQLFF